MIDRSGSAFTSGIKFCAAWDHIQVSSGAISKSLIQDLLKITFQESPAIRIGALHVYPS